MASALPQAPPILRSPTGKDWFGDMADVLNKAFKLLKLPGLQAVTEKQVSSGLGGHGWLKQEKRRTHLPTLEGFT